MEVCFSVQRSRIKPFGRIPVDQTIEITVNRDIQTTGATTKFSLKQCAMKRYDITPEYRSGFLRKTTDMVEVQNLMSAILS